MIFVTVGSQMPFDRLIAAADKWISQQDFKPDVLMQTCGGNIYPRNARAVENLTPDEFQECCARATLVVSHAGMGTIITALALGKPIVILPRRGDLRETRNDHQVATARWLATRDGVYVAYSEDEISSCMDRALGSSRSQRISIDAPAGFADSLRAFIDQR